MIGTINRTMAELVSDSLVLSLRDGQGCRRRADRQRRDLQHVHVLAGRGLTRAGRLDEARFIFEKMLTYANHLGLYAEEIGPCGEALGNFPQAFTHMGLISAAFNLNRRLENAD